MAEQLGPLSRLRRPAPRLNPQDEKLLLDHCQRLAQLLNDPNADPAMKQAAMDDPMSRMCMEMFPQLFMLPQKARGGPVRSPLEQCKCRH